MPNGDDQPRRRVHELGGRKCAVWRRRNRLRRRSSSDCIAFINERVLSKGIKQSTRWTCTPAPNWPMAMWPNWKSVVKQNSMNAARYTAAVRISVVPRSTLTHSARATFVRTWSAWAYSSATLSGSVSVYLIRPPYIQKTAGVLFTKFLGTLYFENWSRTLVRHNKPYRLGLFSLTRSYSSFLLKPATGLRLHSLGASPLGFRFSGLMETV